MTVYPKKYNKKDFLIYLTKIKVKEEIITNFEHLPETLTHSGNTFKLDINSIWYGKGETHYTFELNYYSEDLIEYLFSSKVFNDIEVSINYLYCELINGKYINDGECEL